MNSIGKPGWQKFMGVIEFESKHVQHYLNRDLPLNLTERDAQLIDFFGIIRRI